jgi:hypothetical protein
MIPEVIRLHYELPTGMPLDIEISRERLLNSDLFSRARRLHEAYEKDILFIPSNLKTDPAQYLAEKYSRSAVVSAEEERPSLEDDVFSIIGGQLNTERLTASRSELTAFFDKRIEEENRALKSPEPDPTIRAIRESATPRDNLLRLLIQFSIEFLSEGSNMALYVGGAYGPLQSNLFKILIDEMGGGVYADKHSHLFENMCKSLQLDPIPGGYKDHILTSNYLISDYMYNVCRNKRFFFRYLGVFFRNEACFVNWQHQLSIISREVFGEEADRSYFDVHAEVDQVHGRAALTDCVLCAIDQYGDSIIPEILRGYYELSVYQDLLDVEFRHQMRVAEKCGVIAIEPNVRDAEPLLVVRDNERQRVVTRSDAIVVPASGATGTMTGVDARQINLSAGIPYVLPAFYPVWISGHNGPISVVTAG